MGKKHKKKDGGSDSDSSGSSSDSSSNSASKVSKSTSSKVTQEEKTYFPVEETREASLEAGDEESMKRIHNESSRGLLSSTVAASTAAVRQRGDSSSDDSDSSGGDSDDEERTGEYKFDPVTEYMIKHGRQNAQLDAAWDFYAKFTMPKYTRAEGNSGRTYRLQEPGEEGGQFYSLWGTPLSQLGDFGLGVGLYFQTLAVMGFVFLIAGLANASSIIYFRSNEYSGGQDQVNEQIAKGSAACTLRQVVCLDIFCDFWTQSHRPCEIDLESALLDFCTIVVLFFVLLLLGRIQNSWAKKLDLATQTAADYSIMVEDPNPTDTRPSVWRKFFSSRFGHVTYVTTAVKCGSMVRHLSRRFEILEKIRIEAQGGQEEEDIARDPTAVMSRERWPAPCWKRCLMKIGIGKDIVYWHEELVKVSNQIAAEVGTKPCTKVFVTFEKENSQRQCLETMTTGFLLSQANVTMGDKCDLVLNGNVLSVNEAPEPAEIIWENLEYGFARRLCEFSTRALLTVVLVGVTVAIIFGLSQAHATAAAAFIAVNNTILPKLIIKMQASHHGGEHHHTHSTYQASMMFKIVIAQWMNTAFVIYLIHSITTAPSEEYVSQVSKILWADAFTQPLLKVLDIGSRFKQYVLAPFAKTQAKMNSYFLGAKVQMAERYASMLKTMFVCLFFSAIFPQGYFVCSMAMFMTYWSSKYCLFNRWRRPPPINDSLTILTRRYLAVALVIHILVSLQYYAGWPFDDLCMTGDVVVQDFQDEAGVNFTVTAHYGVSSILPTVGDPVYEYCDQDSPLVWGETPEDWMPDDQFVTVGIFSIFGIVATFMVAFCLFGNSVWSSIRRLFAGVYKPVGHATAVGFSEVDQINAYIPEVRLKKRAHPLLIADIGYVNKQHISWTGDFNAYNLCTPDAFPGMTRKERLAQFSRVIFYRPPPPPEDGARGLPTPTRMHGIPL